MLIGCCHCGEPSESIPSESTPPSESQPSESVPSESVPSESIGPPVVGLCGACYNLPGAWAVSFPGTITAEFGFGEAYDAGTMDDCRSVFEGDFVLQSVVTTEMSGGARVLVLGGGSNLDGVCKVWQSDERAPDAVSGGCVDTEFPRWELIAYSLGAGNPSDCSTTYFTLFMWWVQYGGIASLTSQFALRWTWSVNRVLDSNGNCVFQNCVQCFDATYDPVPYVIDMVYDLFPVSGDSTDAQVCPY